MLLRLPCCGLPLRLARLPRCAHRGHGKARKHGLQGIRCRRWIRPPRHRTRMNDRTIKGKYSSTTTHDLPSAPRTSCTNDAATASAASSSSVQLGPCSADAFHSQACPRSLAGPESLRLNKWQREAVHRPWPQGQSINSAAERSPDSQPQNTSARGAPPYIFLFESCGHIQGFKLGIRRSSSSRRVTTAMVGLVFLEMAMILEQLQAPQISARPIRSRNHRAIEIKTCPSNENSCGRVQITQADYLSSIRCPRSPSLQWVSASLASELSSYSTGPKDPGHRDSAHFPHSVWIEGNWHMESALLNLASQHGGH